jgi:hypothetical protein
LLRPVGAVVRRPKRTNIEGRIENIEGRIEVRYSFGDPHRFGGIGIHKNNISQSWIRQFLGLHHSSTKRRSAFKQKKLFVHLLFGMAYGGKGKELVQKPVPRSLAKGALIS